MKAPTCHPQLCFVRQVCGRNLQRLSDGHKSAGFTSRLVKELRVQYALDRRLKLGALPRSHFARAQSNSPLPLQTSYSGSELWESCSKKEEKETTRCNNELLSGRTQLERQVELETTYATPRLQRSLVACVKPIPNDDS